MSTWISFEAIKKSVSLSMVLSRYGVQLRQVSDTSHRGKCPLPMHGSDKSKASFAATFTKGLGGVWACQSNSCIAARGGKKGGNALDFVATMEGCTIRDAAAKLAVWFSISTGTSEQPAKSVRESERTPAQLVSKEEADAAAGGDDNKPLTFKLQKIDHTHQYLQEREVDEDTARKFGVGIFGGKGTMHGRCVVPIHNSGSELVAYAGRAIDGTDPKYKLPVGFHKSLELYNLHRVLGESNERQRVVIVEGFFDCIRVSVAGFPCVALMGSSMSKVQEELIVQHFKAVCILLDGDEAGQAGASDCVTRLGRRMWTYAPALPEGKQPDMLSVEEIQAFVKK